MTPENKPANAVLCDRCENRFEAEQLPAECPQCGTTVTRRPPAEAGPADRLAERFRAAVQFAKGNF
jgi:hypothetical protein